MISIIIGTNRPNSLSSEIAALYAHKLHENGASSRIVNLADLPPDFIFSALYDNAGNHPGFNQVQEIVDSTHKFVFIVPEYNGSFPGVLKAFFDGLRFPDSFKGKTSALVGISSGNQGGALAMSHLSDILNYLGMVVIPLRMRMPNIEHNFSDGKLTNSVFNNLLNQQVKQLVSFCNS